MRAIKLITAIGLSVVVQGAGLAHAQNTQNFSITSFQADYYLDQGPNQESLLKTIELIQAQFPSYDQNHGILRAIPETYQNHTVSLKIDSVTDENNQPQPYTSSDQNDNLVLKIGNPRIYVHGAKTYKITYETANVTALFSDHDEFYWNVNGNQWQQPFSNVTGRLHISAGLKTDLQNRLKCYAGPDGSVDTSRCQISQSAQPDGTSLIVASANGLSPGENLTMVAGFNQGTFKLGPQIAQAQKQKRLRYLEIAVATAAAPLLTLIFMFYIWRRYGRDPKGRGVIIPEYQPPKGLNVLTSDFIFLEKLDTKAVTALVIELAIRRYVNIYEVDKSRRFLPDSTTYKLKLIKDPSDLTMEERDVLRMFFSGLNVGDETDLSTLNAKLATYVKTLKINLGKSLLSTGYFRNDPNKATTKYSSMGILLIFGGFFLASSGHLPIAGLSIIICGAIIILFSRYMPSRSETGVLVHDHMLGLRDYIKLAEADRLKFLQSPQGTEKIQEAGLNPNDPQFKVKLFESLLPYAMIFGLEKDWAKQFENVYSAPPQWYSGNWTAFNTGYLVSSLGNFSNASAVTFSPPHSSGGSGFGGGFSGGGGGGGGGGGW